MTIFQFMFTLIMENSRVFFELIFAEGKLIEIKHRKSAGIEPLPSKLMKEAVKVIEVECNFISESWFNYFVKNITPETKKSPKKYEIQSIKCHIFRRLQNFDIIF